MSRKKTTPSAPAAPDLWSGAGWSLICGDWTAGAAAQLGAEIKRLEQGARVHVISDPTYGEATHNGMARYKPDPAGRAAQWEVTPLSFEPIQPAELVPLLLAIPGLSGWIVTFAELEALGAYKAAAGKRWRRAGIAPRIHPQPQMTGDRPAVAADGLAIIWGGKGRSIWSKGGHAATWDLATCREPDRFHETQKPVGIMNDLILDFTAPGDLIVDPFAGAATTGVAALAAGRRFVGVEVQRRYAERAAARLKLQAERIAALQTAPPDAGRHARQPSIFGED